MRPSLKTLSDKGDIIMKNEKLFYEKREKLAGARYTIGKFDKVPESCKLKKCRWIKWCATPAENLIYATLADFTDHKPADAAQKERLENKSIQPREIESIGTFAGGIAHDFNNILTAIMGYTELAIDNASEPDKVKQNLKKALMASTRARDLVSQIITFSRQADKKFIPIKFNFAIIESLWMLRPMIPSNIKIRQNLKVPAMVMADPTQIHQVMMNLCSNAVHAMTEGGGELDVRLEKSIIHGDTNVHDPDLPAGSYVKLTISDTGQGMPPEVMKRIFDPYFTTKEKELGRGRGLGLSVVHGIVKSHGGAITCMSTPGKGTTFVIYLPEIESGKETIGTIEETSLPTGTERILFIDDEQVIVNLAEEMLSKLGYDVVAKTSSVEALALFQENPDKFDLIITDMSMPAMTGDRLAQNILGLRSDIPIILCTGYSKDITEEKAKSIGIRAFIMKPVEMRVMAETIRKVLD